MKRSFLGAALAAALWILVPVAPVAAGPIADKAREAEEAAAAGRHLEAFDLLREALIEQWSDMPLGFRAVTFVADEPGGYGIYDPRGDNVFDPGETMIIYAEPVGFGWERDGGIYRSLMTVDLILRTAGGEIIAGQKDFGTFAFNSREHNLELMTHLTINVTGVSSGDYVVEVVYRDHVTGAVASLELPFEIR